MTTISFEGQVAIVTGSGRGLGRTYAEALARRGAKLVINDVPGSEDVADAVASIKAGGGMAVPSYRSVATPEGGSGVIDDAVAAFGRVDILIHNAGILRPGYFESLPAADLDSVIDVHLRAAFYVGQPAFRLMRENGYGRIVNICSGTIFGFSGMSNYAAAKAGVLGLTQTLALEGAEHGIKVNAVLPAANSPMASAARGGGGIPGYAVDERMSAARQTLMPRYDAEAVAALVALLSSEACPVNGEAYSAMAGRYARVFLGLADGWLSPSKDQMTPEDILANFAMVRDTTNFIVPERIRDEFEAVAAQITALK